MHKTDTLYITRFVAAMAIVVHHFIPSVYRTAEWENLFHNFNEGVNYFFFLSGFVMVIAYQKYIFDQAGKFPKVKYWIKRFARIYPVYLLALLVILCFHFFVTPSFTSIWERLPFELVMLQQWIGFGSINSPAWSISCEIFFYLVFPFVALRFKTLKGNRLGKAMVSVMGTIILLTIFGLLVYQYNQQHRPAMYGFIHGVIHYHPLLRVITFIAGNLCGIWYLRNTRFLNRMAGFSPYLLVISSCAILAVMFIIPVKNAIILNYGLLCPLYFLFVVSICNLKGRLLRLLSTRSCIFLGDISYGVYILQVPVQLFFVKFFITTNTLTGFLVYCGVLIILSSLSYILIEKPMRKKLADLLITRWSRKPALKMSPVN